MKLDPKDAQCPDIEGPIADMVVSLRWGTRNSHNIDLLTSTSWDGIVRVWRVDAGTTTPTTPTVSALGAIKYPSALPPNDAAINSELALATVGIDRKGYLYDVRTLGPNAQPRVFAQANAGFCRVMPLELGGTPAFVTATWDGMVAIWDCRQQAPAVVRQFSQPVVDLDVRGSSIGVCFSRGVFVSQADQLATGGRDFPPHDMVKKSLRSIALFGFEPNSPLSNRPGFAVGSTEGRVAIEYLNPADHAARFTFKAHRLPIDADSTPDTYPVHDVSFHTPSGVLATCGGDGMGIIWNKESKLRVHYYPRNHANQPARLACPVVRLRFNPSGQFLACAASYDGQRGLAVRAACATASLPCNVHRVATYPSAVPLECGHRSPLLVIPTFPISCSAHMFAQRVALTPPTPGRRRIPGPCRERARRYAGRPRSIPVR